jgi:tRNA-dihydrouridine synthase A
MTRHLVGLFSGRPGARIYRQKLSTLATRHGAGIDALNEAIAAVRREPVAA